MITRDWNSFRFWNSGVYHEKTYCALYRPCGRPFRSTPTPVQFSVYLRNQDSPDPISHTSRNWAERAISADLAVKIGQNSIRLTISGMKWAGAKALMRGRPDTLNAADSYHCLPHTFPLPYEILRHYRR